MQWRHREPRAPRTGAGLQHWQLYHRHAEASCSTQYQPTSIAEDNKRDAIAQLDPTAKLETYKAPRGYDDVVDHFRNFFNSVRTRQEPIEDATFGYRAAGAALLSLVSLERGEAVRWNPETMKLEGKS